jgi:sugar phosphate isomerase/epimerase
MMDAYPVPQALERIKNFGLNGVEICVEDAGFGVREELLDPGYLDEVGAALVELEYESWSYSYHADYITNDEVLARTIRTIELTRRVGTDIFVFSGRRRDKLADPAEQWRALVRRTRMLADAAEANGVRLALETEPGFYCGTTAELLRLIEELGSDALGANMDIGHSFLCDPDPMAAIAALGSRIYHAHIENMRRGVHDHRLPQDGDMVLSSYLQALIGVGFTGPAAFDLYGYDYEAVLPDSVEYVQSILSR